MASSTKLRGRSSSRTMPRPPSSSSVSHSRFIMVDPCTIPCPIILRCLVFVGTYESNPSINASIMSARACVTASLTHCSIRSTFESYALSHGAHVCVLNDDGSKVISEFGNLNALHNDDSTTTSDNHNNHDNKPYGLVVLPGECNFSGAKPPVSDIAHRYHERTDRFVGVIE